MKKRKGRYTRSYKLRMEKMEENMERNKIKFRPKYLLTYIERVGSLRLLLPYKRHILIKSKQILNYFAKYLNF
jgi:hypothetical protein